MPETQAAFYALYSRGNAVSVGISARDQETEDSIRSWLAQRNTYAPPDLHGDSNFVVVLLPVGQIGPLAKKFPEAFLQGSSIQSHGLPMLRSQWPPETLYFEKSVTQQYLDPDSDQAQAAHSKGIAPCSFVAGGG